MTANDQRSYDATARAYALQLIDQFSEEMADMAAVGDVSDDINNDYPNGDAAFHETAVDRDYPLLEAARLLDELSDHEETDNGLWDGADPRRAISIQAAYTMGNAVAHYWREFIRDMNDELGTFEFGSTEDEKQWRSAWAQAWIELHTFATEDADLAALVASAIDGLRDAEPDRVGVLCDWLEERNLCDAMVRRLRSCVGRCARATEGITDEE